MKTLLERAKPQLLEAIEREGVKYPGTISEFKKELSKKYYVNNLEYQFIITMEGLNLPRGNFFHPWNYFEEID